MRRVFLLTTAIAMLLIGPAQAASWTGRGNEPSWQVEVSEGAVRFSSLDGASVTLDPVPEPALAEGVAVYVGGTEGASLALVATEKICSDTMSGMPHPKTVVVLTGDKVFLGCGGDPLSLLLGEWQVDEIEGAAVLPKTDPSLGFDADGSFHGSTSCNRYFGSFALTGEALTLSPAGTTRMACENAVMDQETRFLAALEKVDRFELSPAGQIRLLGADGVVLAGRKSD